MGETGESSKNWCRRALQKHEGEVGGQVRWSRMLVTGGPPWTAQLQLQRKLSKRIHRPVKDGKRLVGLTNTTASAGGFVGKLEFVGGREMLPGGNQAWMANDFMPRWELAILLEVDAPRPEVWPKGQGSMRQIEQYREILKTKSNCRCSSEYRCGFALCRPATRRPRRN